MRSIKIHLAFLGGIFVFGVVLCCVIMVMMMIMIIKECKTAVRPFISVFSSCVLIFISTSLVTLYVGYM